MKVDVIIPTCFPGERFVRLVDMLNRQTLTPNKIIVMNTEEAGFERLIRGSRFLERNKNLTVRHLSKREFDHGRTRNTGVRRSEAEIFVCMTQDALPADVTLLERLVAALLQPGVAVAYARQLPEEDCNFLERYIREFNYGPKPILKGQEDLERLGIKTFFCSNVCAAYRRDIFNALGGFVDHTIFNEDMIYAAKAVQAGYKIAYAAQASVVHSHNYTVGQLFRRNFDLGVSHAQYPEVFKRAPAEGEGVRMIRYLAGVLFPRHMLLLGKLFCQSGAKYVGYRLGRSYRFLPRKLILKCTSQKNYWY